MIGGLQESKFGACTVGSTLQPEAYCMCRTFAECCCCRCDCFWEDCGIVQSRPLLAHLAQGGSCAPMHLICTQKSVLEHTKVSVAHFEVPARATSHSCRNTRPAMYSLRFHHFLLQFFRHSCEANSRSKLLAAAGHNINRCINHLFGMDICPSTVCRGNEISQPQSILLLTRQSNRYQPD